MDIGFVVDVSESVGNYWPDEQTFVKRIAESIGISPIGGHAAVVLFSSSAEQYIKFTDHDDIAAFKAAVDALPYTMGGTRIDIGLEVAFTQMFNIVNGMRPTVPKAVVVITDGKNNVDLEPLNAAEQFHDAGIKVIAIGVGDVDEDELLSLVKVENDLHLAEDFDQLISDAFVDSIANCSALTGKALHIFS